MNGLRLRLWIGGELRDEVWLDAANPARQVGDDHARLTGIADDAGVPWLVEVYDPAAPADEAYLRFGTDTAGMVWPSPGSLTCPRCGRTSYHPDDIREGYCGACHDWTRVRA